jgi:hypothetical protein
MLSQRTVGVRSIRKYTETSRTGLTVAVLHQGLLCFELCPSSNILWFTNILFLFYFNNTQRCALKNPKHFDSFYRVSLLSCPRSGVLWRYISGTCFLWDKAAKPREHVNGWFVFRYIAVSSGIRGNLSNSVKFPSQNNHLLVGENPKMVNK